MDKNYNVDDILSEIKQRKTLEKGAPPARQRPATTARPTEQRDTAPPPRKEFTPSFSFDDDTPAPAPPAGRQTRGRPAVPLQDDTAPVTTVPPRPRRSSSPPRQQEPAGFQFQAPEGEPAHKDNPMEFTGHVRPLTDRAKMRGNRLNGTAQPPAPSKAGGQEFSFEPQDEKADAGHTARIDFSAFRSPLGGSAEPSQEHTRVLPQFATGREFQPEDIKNMDFSQAAENYDGYYEEEGPEIFERPAVDFSEYNSKSDRKEVAIDIARVKMWLFLRAGLTLVLTVVLFVLAFGGKYPAVPLPPAIWPEGETMRTFMLTCTILTGLVAVVCSSAMGGGIISLFKMRANSDSLAAFAVLAALAQGVMGVVDPARINPEALNFYFPVAALAMFFNALGKMTMINRIQLNFRIIASERKKKAVLSVDSDAFCHEFIKEPTRYRPVVAYSAPAGFFTDFLGLSYSDKYDVGLNRSVAPVCLLGSLIVGGSVFFLTRDAFTALSSLTAILCVCASLSATFIENVPLGKLTKKLAPQGGMVSGNKAVEAFCDVKGIVLTETDLFPQGHVTLQGIKAFSQNRIDEAILDAASIICHLDGALSSVFLEMIGGDRKLLRKVDNVVYENGMGISAWVSSHRVLIGNRQLMLNHGVSLPTDKYEQGSVQVEGEPLYLATSGEVSARFIVGYHIDEDLAQQLDHMAARETRLIVYTNDANITEHKLWMLYGYPEDLITVMPAQQQEEYRRMAAPLETARAEIAYTGKAATLVRALLACSNARASILLATIIQLLQIILGYGLVAFIAFMGSISSLGIVELCIYQMFWFLAIFVVQKVRQS